MPKVPLDHLDGRPDLVCHHCGDVADLSTHVLLHSPHHKKTDRGSRTRDSQRRTTHDTAEDAGQRRGDQADFCRHFSILSNFGVNVQKYSFNFEGTKPEAEQ
jgi:hypothetical protein